jgi:hypothetical protein
VIRSHPPLNLGGPSLFDIRLGLPFEALQEQTRELRAISLGEL